MSENPEIPAIHDDDLKKILSDHNLLTEIELGKAKCVCCNCDICWENLSGIILKDNIIRFVCDSPDCINEKIE